MVKETAEIEDTTDFQANEIALRRFVIGDLIGIGLLAFLAWFIYTQRAELGSVASAVMVGDWPWLFVAGFIEVIYLLTNARYYQAALQALDVDFPLIRTVAIRLTAEILSVLTASEFLTTQAVFLYNARQQEHSRSRTAFGILIAQLAELATFFLILGPAVLILVWSHHLHGYEVAAGDTLLALFLLAIGLVAALFVWPKYVTTLLRIGQRLVTAFGHPHLITDAIVVRARRALRETLLTVRNDWRAFLPVLLLAMAGQILRLGCFLTVLFAFHVEIPFPLVVAGYAIGTLVWIISPIPQGIGLVEGAYGLALVSFGVNPAIATTVALAFRGIVFWLPFLAGLPAFRRFRPQAA